MTELAYIETAPNGSWCSLPYFCSTNTSIVFKNLHLPLGEQSNQGMSFIAEGPGRFNWRGDGFDVPQPRTNDPYLRAVMGYYNQGATPATIYYNLEWYVPNGIDGDLELGNAYIKLDDVIVATGTTYTGDTITLTQPLYVFNHFNSAWVHNYVRSGRCGTILVYESGVLAAKYTPYLDDNNVAGFYDENNQTMIYSLGNPWIAGPDASSISINPSSKNVKATGETFTIDVTTENSWVANPSDGTWYTISPTGATGDASVTITVPSYTGTTARQDTITFVDTNTTDEAEFTLKQKKYQSGQPFYLGGDEIGEIYLGEDSISEAYLGENLVFSTGPFVGLKVSPKSLTFSNSTLTGQFKVKSSEQWSLTTPAWITASTSTGDTGETIVSVTATTQTAATSSTISISSTSFSASVQTDYVFYTAVSYIYATDHSRYVQANHIDTGIEHTASTMTVEIEYYGYGGNSDRMVGYQQGDEGCPNDNTDFRVFGFSNGTFDYKEYRNSFGSSYNSGYHHCTIGDCFCYDNESDTYKCQGTAVGSVPSPNCHIVVDVSYIKVKSVKIKDGNNVLFDGVAATFEGNVGLYDLVSGQLVYNSNVPMSYDE